MKNIALLSTAAALGYASGDKPAAKMPEAPVAPAASTEAPAATAPKAAKVAPEVTGIVAGIQMPETARRGGQASPYAFDSLEVGQCFGVKNKDKSGVGPAVTNANRKGKQEIKDAAGNVVNTVQVRHFVAFDVTPELEKQIKDKPELAGSKVLVFRDI